MGKDVDLPGIFREKQKEIRKSKVTLEYLQAFKDDLFNEENCVSIRIPEECRDSFEGGIIGISHLLRITLMTKATVTSPCIVIPIRIGYAPVNENKTDQQKLDENATKASEAATSIVADEDK